MKAKHIITFAVGLLFFIATNAQIVDCQNQFGDSIPQFDKAEWNISLIGDWTNPYDPDQIALDMVFIAPDGSKGKQPCFYVEGPSGGVSSWKSRFASSLPGEYQIWFELRSQNKLISSSPKQSFKCTESDKRGFLRPNDLWTFRFDNGELFRGIGENICWESRNVDDSKYFKQLHEDKRFNYDYMISKLSKSGGNFFRTWMVYWNLPVDWKHIKNNNRYTTSNSCYNQSAMLKLDHLVDLCDSLGVYMMLALESHVGYMGEGWDMSSYNIKNGGFASTPYEFFTNDQSKKQYKDKLRLMIARYGYSPSIAVWEFFNEIDHLAFDQTYTDGIPGQVIADWHYEMAEWLKANDPYRHMVSSSISHREIEGLNDIQAIDFNQRHIYGNAFTIPEVIRSNVEVHNKPYVIGESGYHWDWSLNFNDYLSEFCGDFRKDLWLGLFSPTPILPMSWWWEFFENNGMMEYFANVQCINKEMIESAKSTGMEEVEVNAPFPLFALAVQCGNRIFVYANNDSDKDSDASIKLSGLQGIDYKVELFNTITKDREILYCSLSTSDQVIEIPRLKLAPHQDCILILSENVKDGNRLSEIVYNTNCTGDYYFPTHNNLLVMDRAYANSAEVFVVEIEPGKATHRHIHDDTEQLYYVLSGDGYVDIELDGKEYKYDFHPTQVVHIPMHCYHQTFCNGDEMLRYLAIDCFPGGKNPEEPTWDTHAQTICNLNGWNYEDSRKDPFFKPTTAETRALLKFLKDISKRGVMFGHQDDCLYGIGWKYQEGKSDVKSVCQDWPAVIGFDLGRIELGDSKNLDDVPFQIMKDEIIKQYQRGGLTTISWHCANPKTGESAWDISDSTVVASILPGGVNYEKFAGWMDNLAEFLGSLKTKDGKAVPIIFRPFHEHTGNWFWWGDNLCTPLEYKSLWKMLCQHLKNKGVDNVIYAYSTGTEPTDLNDYLDKYPGDDYVDLIGFDYYQRNPQTYSENMKRLLEIITEAGAKHQKPIAITETGLGGLNDKNWWTKSLYPIIKDYPLCYVLLWRNTDDAPNHIFVPYQGQKSQKDFVNFYHKPDVLFLSDIK